jgi:hypothetical protein
MEDDDAGVDGLTQGKPFGPLNSLVGEARPIQESRETHGPDRENNNGVDPRPRLFGQGFGEQLALRDHH